MSIYREEYSTLNSSCTWRAVMAKFSLCKMTLTKWKFGHEGLISAWGLYFFSSYIQYQSCNMCISDPFKARGENTYYQTGSKLQWRSMETRPSVQSEKMHVDYEWIVDGGRLLVVDNLHHSCTYTNDPRNIRSDPEERPNVECDRDLERHPFSSDDL